MLLGSGGPGEEDMDEDFFLGGPVNAAAAKDSPSGTAALLPLQHPQGSNTTIVKLNKAEEEALIRELESEAMGNDTLKELDEALMDRTTAQKTLRSKTNLIAHHQHTKINSSNFKSNQEPA